MKRYYYAVEWPHGVCTCGNTGKPWNSVFRFDSRADRTAWIDTWGHFGPKRRDENGYRQAISRKEVETRIRSVERYFDRNPNAAWMDTDGPEMLNE